MSTKYNYLQKKAISRKIADITYIDRYRELLRAVKSPAAGRKMLDRQQLAVSLVYELLAYYTEAQIEELSVQYAPGALANAPSSRPSAVKKKASKFEQYPHIRWFDMDNDLVRTADSIFTDRINLYHRLQEIEKGLDGLLEVDRDAIESMVMLSIRSELCFSELKSFNDTGRFIGQHPFIRQKDERQRVAELLRTDPDRYFDERKNVELNITRYSSQLNGKKATQEQKDRAVANLEKFKTALHLYKDVFNEFIKR